MEKLADNTLYDEKALLGEIVYGSEQAFNVLFGKYRLPVYMHVLSIVKSPQRSEEITQDVFVQIWKKRAELAFVQSFADWLFILTKNHALSELRKRLSQLRPVAGTGIHYGDDPLGALLYKETSHLLQRAIDKLPPRRKQIFLMSRFENKTHKEIAYALGISAGTVNIQLVQALASLRTYLHNAEKDNKNFPGEYIYLLLVASLSV